MPIGGASVRRGGERVVLREVPGGRAGAPDTGAALQCAAEEHEGLES